MRVKDLLLVTLVVSEKVQVGTEIPGGGGKRETIPNATLSPPE